MKFKIQCESINNNEPFFSNHVPRKGDIILLDSGNTRAVYNIVFDIFNKLIIINLNDY